MKVKRKPVIVASQMYPRNWYVDDVNDEEDCLWPDGHWRALTLNTPDYTFRSRAAARAAVKRWKARQLKKGKGAK